MSKFYTTKGKFLFPAIFLFQTLLFSSFLLPTISKAQCTSPVLVVKQPAAVCSPNTINLKDQVDYSASTLPNGYVLTFYDDNNNGIPVSDPSMVGVSGIYTIR